VEKKIVGMVVGVVDVLNVLNVTNIMELGTIMMRVACAGGRNGVQAI